MKGIQNKKNIISRKVIVIRVSGLCHWKGTPWKFFFFLHSHVPFIRTLCIIFRCRTRSGERGLFCSLCVTPTRTIAELCKCTTDSAFLTSFWRHTTGITTFGLSLSVETYNTLVYERPLTNVPVRITCFLVCVPEYMCWNREATTDYAVHRETTYFSLYLFRYNYAEDN
jgi:hypothetical protein